MTFTEYTLDNTPINARPDCPQCTAQMYLARIEPEKPGHDLVSQMPACRESRGAVQNKPEGVTCAFAFGIVHLKPSG